MLRVGVGSWGLVSWYVDWGVGAWALKVEVRVWGLKLRGYGLEFRGSRLEYVGNHWSVGVGDWGKVGDWGLGVCRLGVTGQGVAVRSYLGVNKLLMHCTTEQSEARTVSSLLTTPASMPALFMDLRTSNSGASMKTT